MEEREKKMERKRVREKEKEIEKEGETERKSYFRFECDKPTKISEFVDQLASKQTASIRVLFADIK